MSKSAKAYQMLQFQLGKVVRFVDRKALHFVIAFVCVYAAVFSGFTIYMHYAFATYAWDLGIFTQSLWTTIHKGQFFYYTVELPLNPSGSFLGAHFAPILFLVLPIYALFQSPSTLLVLQSIVLALGAVPLYFIAKKHLGDRLSAVGLAAVYLIYPAIQCVNCFDFHTEAFIPLFFLLAFYYIDEKKWFRGLLFVLLTISTIEFAPILILFLGGYFALREIFVKDLTGQRKSLPRRMSMPITLIVVAIIGFFTAFLVIDTVNPMKGLGLPGNWTYWGSNLSGVFLNILTHPIQALTYMVTPTDKVFYLFFLLAPLLMLPIFSLEFLLVLPWPVAALLSGYGGYYYIYNQYSAFVIGQLFIAMIFSVKRWSLFGNAGWRNLKLQRTVIAFALVVTILFSVALSPIGLPDLSSRSIQITPHSTVVNDILNLVPDNASIATQNEIFPHVAQRENAYILTWPMPMEVDYILVDMKSTHFGFFAISASPSQALPKVLSSGAYGLLASEDSVLLFEKGYSGPPKLYVGRVDTFDSSSLIPALGNSIVVNDPSASSGAAIVHEADQGTGFVWYGPYAYFFAGEYQATFRMKTSSQSLNFVVDVANSAYSIAERNLNSSDFKTLGQWQDFTLNFTLSGLSLLEFRGICQSNDTSIALDYVRVVQVNP